MQFPSIQNYGPQNTGFQPGMPGLSGPHYAPVQALQHGFIQNAAVNQTPFQGLPAQSMPATAVYGVFKPQQAGNAPQVNQRPGLFGQFGQTMKQVGQGAGQALRSVGQVIGNHPYAAGAAVGGMAAMSGACPYAAAAAGTAGAMAMHQASHAY